MEKKSLNIEVGRRIREIREYQHFTREQLSEKANISIQFLSDIENGYKSMTALTIINLAKALNISTDYILLGKSSSDNSNERDEIIFNLLAALPEEKKQSIEKHFLINSFLIPSMIAAFRAVLIAGIWVF